MMQPFVWQPVFSTTVSAASKVRALESLARVHGLTNDRSQHRELNRETPLRDIDDQLLQLARSR
jgi:hypothetical protein